MGYEHKDYFHKKAKSEGYAARSAYKLKEIQKKYRIISPSAHVLDLGCSPGSWIQVAKEILSKSGKIVGVDLQDLSVPVDGFRFLKLNALDLELEHMPEAPFDCILSDMAPKTSGIKAQDKAKSEELCKLVLDMSDKWLKTGGNLVFKIFESENITEFNRRLKMAFNRVERFRPKSTRKASTEIYFIGLGKK